MAAYVLLGLIAIVGSNVERKLAVNTTAGPAAKIQSQWMSANATKASSERPGLDDIDEFADLPANVNTAADSTESQRSVGPKHENYYPSFKHVE